MKILKSLTFGRIVFVAHVGLSDLQKQIFPELGSHCKYTPPLINELLCTCLGEKSFSSCY